MKLVYFFSPVSKNWHQRSASKFSGNHDEVRHAWFMGTEEERRWEAAIYKWEQHLGVNDDAAALKSRRDKEKHRQSFDESKQHGN